MRHPRIKPSEEQLAATHCNPVIHKNWQLHHVCWVYYLNFGWSTQLIRSFFQLQQPNQTWLQYDLGHCLKRFVLTSLHSKSVWVAELEKARRHLRRVSAHHRGWYFWGPDSLSPCVASHPPNRPFFGLKHVHFHHPLGANAGHRSKQLLVTPTWAAKTSTIVRSLVRNGAYRRLVFANSGWDVDCISQGSFTKFVGDEALCSGQVLIRGMLAYTS